MGYAIGIGIGMQFGRGAGGAPSAPSITAPVNQEIITEDAAYTITVSAPGNTSVEIFDGVSSLGTCTDAGSGIFTLSWTPTAPDYDVNLTAVGDVSGTSDNVVVVVAEANRISQNITTWSKSNTTVAGSQADPDGGTSAYRVLCSAVTNTSCYVLGTASLAPSEFASGFEVWLKADGADVVRVYPLEDGATHYADIDLNTGQTFCKKAYAKIVESKSDGWRRIWFRFVNAAAGPRNFILYLCNDLTDNTPTMAGTEAMLVYHPRTADGILPFTAYQKMSPYYVSTTSGVERWDYNHPYINSEAEFDLVKYRIDVIKPTGWSSSGSYPVVYALPALLRASEDVAADFIAGDYSNTYGCVVVIPYFKGTTQPWYGLKDDNTIDEHAFTADVLTAFATEFLAGNPSRETQLLIGYSKSANGAYSLILRNPTKFGYACGWDGPWTIDYASQAATLGIDASFGTEAQWLLYDPYTILAANVASVNDKKRLVLLGYESWQSDQPEMQTLLNNNSIEFDYNATDTNDHSWGGGWLNDGMSRLMTIAGLV